MRRFFGLFAAFLAAMVLLIAAYGAPRTTAMPLGGAAPATTPDN
jgi:hypothetical protein